MLCNSKQHISNKMSTLIKMLFVLSSFLCVVSDAAQQSASCEPMKMDLCREVGYNSTRMPNLAGHKKQADANQEMSTFAPLIQVRCSSELQFFLCSVFAPMCVSHKALPSSSSSSMMALQGSGWQDAIGPCRPLCLRVMQKCAPVMLEFGFPWPASLNCSRFPVHNDHRTMCMEGPGEESTQLGLPPSLFNDLGDNPIFMKKVKEQLSNRTYSRGEVPKKYKEFLMNKMDGQKQSLCSHLARPDDFAHVPRLSTIQEPPCFQKCHTHIIIKDEDTQTNLDITVAVLASITLSLIVLVVVLHFMSANQVPYPDRCLLFLSISLAGLNIGLLFRAVFSRDDIVCQEFLIQDGDVNLLTVEGHRNALCFTTFILVYYFSLCSASWLVAIAVAWLFYEMFSWSLRRLYKRSCFLHLIGWGLPASLAVAAVLTPGGIQAEEALGVCSVGGQTDRYMLYFVILPEVVFLVVSFVLLSLVLSSFILSRDNKRSNNANTITAKGGAAFNGGRLASFCSVYFVVKVALLSCLLIEYYNRGDLRTRGDPSSSSAVSIAVHARVWLAALLGWVVAGFVYLFGAGRDKDLLSCLKAPRKKGNVQQENIPFQDVKYSRQPQSANYTSSKDMNVTASTWTTEQQQPLQQQHQQHNTAIL